ncbi:unnamed protein product [Symbiodinium necroappetens]|uniref:C2 domain-containing protein n=1 Tax=Symbiodinium necroappetens TaxID=1628268 RepID=A0A812ND00_9DINO|nr:unnamed protein product [Symbiodinium necroappetens]
MAVSSMMGISPWQQMEAMSAASSMAQRAQEAVQDTAGFVSGGMFGESDIHAAAAHKEAAVRRPTVVDPSAISKRKWRLCVHHGRDMPSEPTLLEVTTQVNSERQERHVSPVSVASEYPVWDFNMEFDVDLYGGRPLNVEIKVMSARLFGRRHLFSGSLSAAVGSNDVRRQEITLESAPSIFTGAADTNSQLVVAWQLCDPDAAQPELSRVAESGREAMDKQTFIANVGLRKCELRTGFDPNKYDVYLRISGVMLDDVSSEADTELVVEDFPAEPVDDPSDGKTKKNKNVHIFRFKRPSQGDSHFSWSLVASKEAVNFILSCPRISFCQENNWKFSSRWTCLDKSMENVGVVYAVSFPDSPIIKIGMILSDDFEPFVRTLLTMTDAQLKNLFNKYWLAWQDPCPTLPHDTFQAAPPASTHADKALTKEGIPAVAEVTMMCYEDYRREMP